MNAPRLLLPGENCTDCVKTRRALMKLLAPLRRVVLTMYDSLGGSISRRGDFRAPRFFCRNEWFGIKRYLVFSKDMFLSKYRV